ncbi:hypothetical protein [Anaeromicrobium sediminis]|nr:hypothetical protein [Anaeromicrobium sediminis]
MLKTMKYSKSNSTQLFGNFSTSHGIKDNEFWVEFRNKKITTKYLGKQDG